MICGAMKMAKLNRAGRKHPRKENIKTPGPGNYLIVTEGIETEPNYFNGIKQRIESLFRSKIIVDKVSLKVEGRGRSTTSLVNEALKLRSLSTYSEVWVVFDRDENPDFDEAIQLAKKNDLKVAWSNECFELWLSLHFQNLNSAISAKEYYPKLNAHFKSRNINNGIYNKNAKNIFDVTFDFVNDAIKRSNTLFDSYKNCSLPTKMNPCTKVQDLVEDLVKYIK